MSNSNPNMSNLDASQAFKRTMDCHNDAIRVVQAVNTQTYIEMSAEDGDSVESVARFRTIKESDGPVDCGSLRRVCAYGAGTVEVSADGVTYHTFSISNLEIKELCAVKVKVTGLTLVGQS